MSDYNLREALVKVELAIKKNEFDKALELYEKINKNWEEYQKNLNQIEIKELLKLLEYIKNLLLEKQKELFDRKKLFQLRKAYSKF